MTDPMTNPVINVDFIQQRERSAIKHALAAVMALHDAVSLKHELRLPLLDATREAISELEDQVTSLKLALLRQNHPDQLELPMDLPSTKEGEHEASHRGDMAS